MQKNIAATMFYSLLFAMGGAPTLAMLIILLQNVQAEVMYQVFIGLSIMLACVLVPLILLQNGILFFKRHDHKIEAQMKYCSRAYLFLNVLCLVFWLSYQWL